MDSQDKLNVSRDHDLIIAANVKLDQLALSVKDLRDDTITRISKLESRMDSEDLYHAKIDLPRFTADAVWVESFKANYKLIIFFGGIFLGAMGGFIERLLQIWFKF